MPLIYSKIPVSLTPIGLNNVNLVCNDQRLFQKPMNEKVLKFLPNVKDFLRNFLIDVKKKREMTSLLVNVHVTPSVTNTNLDADLNSVLMLNSSHSCFRDVFGDEMHSLILSAYLRWKKVFNPPEVIDITLLDSMSRLKVDPQKHPTKEFT